MNTLMLVFEDILSVIRQKGESKNEFYKKTKHTKFSKNEHLLAPDDDYTTAPQCPDTCVCNQGVNNVRFPDNLEHFVFL